MDENNPQEISEDRVGQLNVAGAVPHIVSDDDTDDLKILLGEFEGPLDLLLHLFGRSTSAFTTFRSLASLTIFALPAHDAGVGHRCRRRLSGDGCDAD